MRKKVEIVGIIRRRITVCGERWALFRPDGSLSNSFAADLARDGVATLLAGQGLTLRCDNTVVRRASQPAADPSMMLIPFATLISPAKMAALVASIMRTEAAIAARSTPIGPIDVDHLCLELQDAVVGVPADTITDCIAQLLVLVLRFRSAASAGPQAAGELVEAEAGHLEEVVLTLAGLLEIDVLPLGGDVFLSPAVLNAAGLVQPDNRGD